MYDFFGSSSLKQQWRLIYEYMKENELLDPRTPEKFPSFNGGKHHLLCSELKQLYVAVTRTKQRLWIYEKMADICSPMFDFWKKKCLIQVRQIDDSLVEKMKVESTPEEWRMRGMKVSLVSGIDISIFAAVVAAVVSDVILISPLCMF